jgi:glycerol dehydrogenase
MRDGNPYIGSGRYIQTENAAGLLGSEMKRYGTRRAFILGGKTALSVSIDDIEKGIRAENIDYTVEEFHGHCTLKKVATLREKAERYGADMIVGVGGGKVLDTAKLLADDMKLRAITVPTSAATCAAAAVLSVVYSDDGDVLYNAFYSHEIASILVDTKILTSRCPPRMVASGVADALAKYPEIVFSMKYSTDWEKTVLPSAAVVLAKHNWDLLFQTGKEALRDAQASRSTTVLEDVICTNIALTGMVSSLVSGGHQLGVAHFFHDAVCKFFKAQQNKFLHGEIVSAGILLQMIVNGIDPLQIEMTRNFLVSIGTPVSLRDLDIEPVSGNIEKIYSYIRTTMNLEEPWMNQRLRSGLEGILSLRH